MKRACTYAVRFSLKIHIVNAIREQGSCYGKREDWRILKPESEYWIMKQVNLVIV